MAQDRSIKVDDISRGFDKGLNTADEQRAAALERLQLVRNAKAAGLQREQKRLTAKYGPNHPRVVAVTAQLEINRGLARDLALETERSKTELPAVDNQTWVVHGYVRDQNRKGLPRLTIALYDGAGTGANWVKDLGYACTDDRGYFKLEVRNLKDRAGTPVFLRVLNGQGATLYMDPKALTPTAGRLDYREIIISGEAVVCPPPSPPPSTSQWTVRGKVVDSSGAVLADLTVGLSDKDGAFAARLGETKTDLTGIFTLTYRAADFRDLIEKNPDLFLRVSGGSLTQPYTDPTALHFAPGRTDSVVVTVKIQAVELKPWTVRGRVTDSTGAALPGLTVSISDREGKLADRFGKTQTGAKGDFELVYPAGAFADLIRQPVDLVVRVLDASGKVLYTHDQALRFTPGKVDTLTIVIKQAEGPNRTPPTR